ncbi:uncharacterized protein LOC135132794 [Zophobas morio]|uniref:uncharacterized protein LOC135132794 n=1 Tax=Zophobas morio TaxID=2755281 RepID=UPI003082AB82
MLLRIVVLATIPMVLAYVLETGKEFDASRYSSKGEKGERGYLGHHSAEKGAQGHHDKANHRKEYAEKAGQRRGYDHADGYYADHQQGDKGSKGFHYEDHGKYAKGHSTKGRHNVHKLNEFKKDTDFYDEDNDQGFEERHGGYEATKKVAHGDFYKGGYDKKGSDAAKYGVAGFVDKGSHYFDDQGYKKGQGQDAYYGNYAKFAKKGGKDEFDKFGFTSFKKE